ncbi:MAG: hypothetical protein HOG49_42530 [Candidatus Scalindua sp.]|jgi:hypothetical protein|nr:hypothetical protein [Candidatus Scalindua sp.]
MSEIVPKGKQLDKTSKLLDDTLNSLVEGFTGIVASDRKDLILSISHIFQRTRVVGLLKALFIEWNQCREKGRIKDEYMNSEQHQECLQEMLDFLDKDSPDERRFSILKAIFLGAAQETSLTKDSVLPQQYMSLCRTLSSGEVLVLQTTFAIADSGSWSTTKYARDWLSKVAEESGLHTSELVEIHERKLIEKNLLTDRVTHDLGQKYADKGVDIGVNYRLTPLAIQMCKFIKEYDPECAIGKKED